LSAGINETILCIPLTLTQISYYCQK